MAPNNKGTIVVSKKSVTHGFKESKQLTKRSITVEHHLPPIRTVEQYEADKAAGINPIGKVLIDNRKTTE